MPIPFGGTTCFWDREPETPCQGQDGTTRYQAGQKRCFASCGIVVGRCLGSSTGGLGLRNYITSPKLTSEQPQRFIWGSADAETHCEGPLLGEFMNKSTPQVHPKKDFHMFQWVG